jgi:molybdopterin-containing oxidoreductase family iron-sulfur binding subunit
LNQRSGLSDTSSDARRGVPVNGIASTLSPEIALRAADEFPADAAGWPPDLSRRSFLKVMGASLALAGLPACNRQPPKEIVPYTTPPEAGFDLGGVYYATAFSHEGFARGILVEAHSGRPTKIEGNPDHPESLGATDAFTQASILSLYDPDRSQAPRRAGAVSTWQEFDAEWLARRRALVEKAGRRLALLTEPTTSPTVLSEIHAVLDALPQATWYQHTALPRYDIGGEQIDYLVEKADVIVAVDSDFLLSHPAALRFSRAFASRRKVAAGRDRPNRLYVVEPTFTVTGSMADVRLALPPSALPDFASRLASAMRKPASAAQPEAHSGADPIQSFVRALADDLRNAAPRVLIVCGPWLGPEVHGQLRALNHQLGGEGVTFIRRAPVRSDADPRCTGDLDALSQALGRGEVENLIVLGANPAYTASGPQAVFAAALRQAAWSVHHSSSFDETGRLCTWHLPSHHYLESWSDLRGFDGTASIVQPLIEPLYSTRNELQLLRQLSGRPAISDYEIVRANWSTGGTALDDATWRQWLDRGVVNRRDEAFAPLPKLASNSDPASVAPASAYSPQPILHFQPDPCVGDGRWANNAWLQELPKPFTHLVWDNAALVGPPLAERLGLENGNVVELKTDAGSITAPVWILPGQADDCVTLHLGYGRTAAGTVGSGKGVNAYPLLPSNGANFTPLRSIRKTGAQYLLVSTHGHFSMEGRNLARSFNAADTAAPNATADRQRAPSLYPAVEYKSYAWGMAIDLGVCTGCNACVIACQAENNIPVVGKEQAARGREMHWLRIDRYFTRIDGGTQVIHQPVPCMHCENAPCELVCPVAATVHSSEGLNDMVYNRCVGTRYCSNNCPYKVRRFNFLDYRASADSSEQLQKNPNVTVRERGVMEKCTYCVQRINAARIRAEKQGRRIRDGEILTACQQACPTEAIVFGDLSDPGSQVSRRKKDPRNYALLEELNTRPRTTYLPRLRNPFPNGGTA